MSTSAQLQALVVTNMYPTPERPALGRFVRDQVDALRTFDGVDVEVFSFGGGGIGAYVRATERARVLYAGRRFDVVHAHFGLSAWPALAVRARVHAVTLHGTDLSHPRSRAITLAALPWLEVAAAVSAELAARIPRWAVRRTRAERALVLPCGVDLARFVPIDRRLARAELGLDPGRRHLLFPADPARPEKRFDRAQALCASLGSGAAAAAGPRAGGAGETPVLLTLGAVAPDQVPLYVNAADAVLVPSDREGFGLAALEALACGVPVIATPHGIAPEALAGVDGAVCAPFSLDRWEAAVRAALAGPDPRIDGRAAAERYSARATAERVLDAWRAALMR